jgi:hypothetical protein
MEKFVPKSSLDNLEEEQTNQKLEHLNSTSGP